MGGLFGGGGDAPEQKPTAEEIELGRQGVEKYNRYVRQYAPLEDKMVAGINRSTVNLNEGRTNADIMQQATSAATQAIERGGVTAGLTSLDALQAGIGRAGAIAGSDAIVADRSTRDNKALGAIEVGLGMSARQQEGLTRMASNANQQALSALENEMTVNNAKKNAMAQVLGTAVGSGASKYQSYKRGQRLDSLFRAKPLNDFRAYG